MRLALVHSPLTGPGCWRPVAQVLEGRGHAALAVDYGAVQAGEGYDALADRIAAAVGPGEAPVLVGHSGAGGLLAGLAQRLAPVATVFVDAILPHPGRSWFDTAPPALAKRLRGLAVEGRLPPWNRWFSIGAPENAIADPAVKAAFVAELPSAPLSYLQTPAPDWPHVPQPVAYVQLSGGYVREALAARNGDWALVRADLHHLAMLTEPDTVADLLEEAMERLGLN